MNLFLREKGLVILVITSCIVFYNSWGSVLEAEDDCEN